MSRMVFEHIDSEMHTSFECYRNEDPFSYSFDVHVQTLHEDTTEFHLTQTEMKNRYRHWREINGCVLDVYDKSCSDY